MAGLDDRLLERLAAETGLFHVAEGGRRLSRGLTEEPLRELSTSLRPGMRTLETGCGGSTVVFAASGAVHTAVTPGESEVERIRSFCAEHGISLDNVRFILESSDRALVGWDEDLDLVLVDGAHRFPFPFLDWHFTAAHLRVGGRLFLDDVPIPAVYALYEFLCREDEWRLVRLCGEKLAVFEKVAEPPDDLVRDWELQRSNLPWKYGHLPFSRRWRKWRDQGMIGTRLRRRLNR